jgi:hypothetical protein
MNDAPTPDAFETLNALIRLASDPSACKARIDGLRRAIDKAEAAEARLAERTARHDEKVARDRDELGEREQKVRQREIKVLDREARVATDLATIERVKADLRSKHHDPNVFGTLTREPDRRDDRPIDAHFGANT